VPQVNKVAHHTRRFWIAVMQSMTVAEKNHLFGTNDDWHKSIKTTTFDFSGKARKQTKRLVHSNLGKSKSRPSYI